MNLPINPGEKYALIASSAATAIEGVVDLGDGLLAVAGRGLQLPSYWQESMGSIWSGQIERASLLLLAKRPSQRPGEWDDENQLLRKRTRSLYWGLLACGRFWINETAPWLTGGHSGGDIDIKAAGQLLPINLLPGLPSNDIDADDLRRATVLARNSDELLGGRGMRRVRLAFQTFASAFEQTNLGQRIHQFVRVVSEGFAKAKGRAEFSDRSIVFAGKKWELVRTQLYLMRNNAEHFNQHGRGLSRLSVRRSLERGHIRAHQAEALARHCIARFVENRRLWPHFRHDARIDAFWKKLPQEYAAFWGTPLDLIDAVAEFDPTQVAVG